jgi:indole-3-glycerol phosphate synthase
MMATADLLATIVAATRRIVEVRSQREPLSALAARAERCEAPAGRFRAAIETPAGSVPRIIAECKRRSPSRGVLRVDYDPVAIAQGYGQAGAAAISVLTEPTRFDGALADLRAVRLAVGLAVVRKDFLIHPAQVIESRAAGSDAILLIAAALSELELKGMLAVAADLGLGALVETHSEEDLAKALATDAPVIGVNARDLETLEVDVERALAMLPEVPSDRVAVLESGVSTRVDVERAIDAGAGAVLVGETLMRSPDPAATIRSLRGAA